MNKSHLQAGTAILLLAASPMVVPVFSPWSGINRRVQEIDVISGRLRETRSLFWIPIKRKITTTRLSEAVAGDPRAAGVPRWELVNTFGPYTRHSPHHIYHSAISQVQMLGMVWEEYEFDAGRRRSTALGLLGAWRKGASDSKADEYLRVLQSQEQKHRALVDE
jgi:hypothetical protein